MVTTAGSLALTSVENESGALAPPGRMTVSAPGAPFAPWAAGVAGGMPAPTGGGFPWGSTGAMVAAPASPAATGGGPLRFQHPDMPATLAAPSEIVSSAAKPGERARAWAMSLLAGDLHEAHSQIVEHLVEQPFFGPREVTLRLLLQ